MPIKIGTLSSVMFYAFYHHRHEPNDDWNKNELSFGSLPGAIGTAVSHWESFSLLTASFVSKILILMYLIRSIKLFAPFFLGYEIGVILLPIEHDWVHYRKSCSIGTPAYYLFQCLEFIGIFATKEDHLRHHKHDHSTVYQGFTSSGLYSKHLDKLADTLWNYLFDKANKNERPLYESMRYVMDLSSIITLIIIPEMLLCLLS
jgi:hypothetical protein